MLSENFDCDGIRNKSDEDEIAFIENVVSRKGIPANFVPFQRSYPNKIFYKEDGEQREWVFFLKKINSSVLIVFAIH